MGDPMHNSCRIQCRFKNSAPWRRNPRNGVAGSPPLSPHRAYRRHQTVVEGGQYYMKLFSAFNGWESRIALITGLSLFLSACSVLGIRTGTEQPPYALLGSVGGNVELRQYQERLAARVKLDNKGPLCEPIFQSVVMLLRKQSGWYQNHYLFTCFNSN